MLDVIKLLEELEENIGVKRFLGELTSEVDIDAIIKKFPAQVYLNKDGVILNKPNIKTQKATDSEGNKYLVEYMNRPEYDDKWIEIRNSESRYVKSVEHIVAFIEAKKDNKKTKISIGSNMKKQEYEESIEDKIKTKYTIYNGNDHSIGDEIHKDSKMTIKKEYKGGHDFINISTESNSLRNRENEQNPNGPAQISSISANVRVTKVSYVKGKQTEESTVYALGQTIDGKNVLSEIIHPVEGETQIKSYPIEDGINDDAIKGNEILKFLKEYNLIHEHTEEDYIKMASKYKKAKKLLYDNQLIAIEEKEKQTITSTDEEIR